jgi:DNA-formamidopyrimidine glycosylase
MPEGPEIRFHYDQIKKIQGRVFHSIRILSGRYIRHPMGKDLTHLQDTLPQKIKHVGVKGKMIWWELENGMGIVVTHGMSGGWRWDRVPDKKIKIDGMWYDEKYNRIEFNIGTEKLFFNDMRNFGTIHITTNREDLQTKINSLGPSVLDHPTETQFWERFLVAKHQKKKIGMLLMDQEIVSGIGNYLRADILWLSKISPYRLFKDLTDSERHNIYKHAISHSQHHYKFMKKHHMIYPEGREKTFLVYGKEKDPHGNIIVTERMGPRTIHWVPGYQV